MKLPSINTLSIEEQQACKRVVCYKAPDGTVYAGAGQPVGLEPGMPIKPQVQLPKNPDDCWTWIGSFTSNGTPTKTHNGRDMIAHRWLWAQLFGPIKPGYALGHTCGNSQCVSPHHCKVMTQAECNRAGNGTILVKGDLQDIREAIDNGVSLNRIARKLGVARSTISSAMTGKSWKKPKLSKLAGRARKA